MLKKHKYKATHGWLFLCLYASFAKDIFSPESYFIRKKIGQDRKKAHFCNVKHGSREGYIPDLKQIRNSNK